MSENPQPTQPWRVPQQARSRERFNSILNAAATLFVESGYESVTADEIAAKANTSVGGLYRFFPDKLAVFLALLDRDLDRLRSLFADLHTAATMQLPLATYISLLVDGFDRFTRDNPAFRTVLLQARLLPSALAMTAKFNRETAAYLAAFLLAKNPNLDRSQVDLIATISVEVATTLDFIALSGDSTFQTQVLTEMKKLLISYLSNYTDS